MPNPVSGASGFTSLPAQPAGDVAAALDAVAGTYVSGMFHDDIGNAHMFVAAGLRRETLPSLNPSLPNFVEQREEFVEPKSFERYLVGYKSSTAICRASLRQNSITAVLDYHGQARTEAGDGAVPGRCKHIAVLSCPWDLDYAKWRKVLGLFLPQEAMLEFLADMVHTIAAPAASELQEAFGDIHIGRVTRFRSRRNDKNGTVTVLYDEQDETGTTRDGSLELPDHVVLVLPMFQGGEVETLTAAVKVRMDKGQLLLGLAVPGLDKRERDGFRKIGDGVAEATSTPVFYVA
jgi:hypothetical protein